MLRSPAVLSLILALALAACRSNGARDGVDQAEASAAIAALYEQHHDEPEPVDAASFAALRESYDERLAELHHWISEGALQSADDHYHAASVLCDSDAHADLELARQLGLRAAELGEPRGLPLAAKAEDSALLKRQRPQRWCTQYVFDPQRGLWSLYPWDTTVSDAERRAMGVPSLSEALARVEELNANPPSLEPFGPRAGQDE